MTVYINDYRLKKVGEKFLELEKKVKELRKELERLFPRESLEQGIKELR